MFLKERWRYIRVLKVCSRHEEIVGNCKIFHRHKQDQSFRQGSESQPGAAVVFAAESRHHVA